MSLHNVIKHLPGRHNQKLHAPLKYRKTSAPVEVKPSPETMARLQKVLGKTLNVRDVNEPIVQQHLEDLALIPDKLLKKMANKVSVHVGNARMGDLDSNQEFGNQHPRGWPPGYKLGDVAGAYNPKSKAVTAGKGYNGSVSVMLHEYGHGIQYQGGISNARWGKLIEHHKKVFDKLPDYLRQGGPGGHVGVEEMWAEGFATTLKNRTQATALYGPEFVAVVDEVLA